MGWLCCAAADACEPQQQTVSGRAVVGRRRPAALTWPAARSGRRRQSLGPAPPRSRGCSPPASCAAGGPREGQDRGQHGFALGWGHMLLAAPQAGDAGAPSPPHQLAGLWCSGSGATPRRPSKCPIRRSLPSPMGPKYMVAPPGLSSSSSSNASNTSAEGWWMVHTAGRGRARGERAGRRGTGVASAGGRTTRQSMQQQGEEQPEQPHPRCAPCPPWSGPHP